MKPRYIIHRFDFLLCQSEHSCLTDDRSRSDLINESRRNLRQNTSFEVLSIMIWAIQHQQCAKDRLPDVAIVYVLYRFPHYEIRCLRQLECYQPVIKL